MKKDIVPEINDILATSDLLSKALKLAGLITRLFREVGWELVVVGGSAVEFYTEGAYMSGDIDMCRRNLDPIPLRTAQNVIGRLGGSGGPRSWKVAGLYIDLLGLLENEAITPCRTIETPYGMISIVPAELILVERVLMAFYPRPDPEARNIAKKIMAVCQQKITPVDWNEVKRLAACPSFDVLKETNQLRKEVLDELKK
ncbi:MAG: hypothetical protein PHP98_06110 [Kiritimatiellae bacterium]|jgi:hypothetical protein|nr:hypothetical protein [Kiritimatiellia bacterium]